MAETTQISWCHSTFNPWIGCAKVAEGCTHCYAEAYAKRYGKAQWGLHGTRVKTSDAYWRQPIKWNREAEAAGVRPRVFCASLADVFEDWGGDLRNAGGEKLFVCTDVRQEWCGNIGDFPSGRPATMNDLRARLFALIDATPNLDWLILTKRPENIRRMLVPHCLEKVPGHVSQNEGDGYRIRRRDNVWLLTSIATQADADKNVPELLKCRDLAPVLGLSAEPLVGPIELSELINANRCTRCGHEYSFREGLRVTPNNFGAICPRCNTQDDCDSGYAAIDAKPCRLFTGWRAIKPAIDWVIVGGESGHGAREFDIDWGRSIIKQCKAAGAACFLKQLGARAVLWDPVADGLGGITGGGGDLPWPTEDRKGGDWMEATA